MRSDQLPVTRSLTFASAASLVVALLASLSAIIGVLYPTAVYPTDALAQSSVPNDMVTLLIGVPVLLGSMWLARRSRLIGLLFWPGALFYVLYNAVVYVFALPLNVVFLFNLILVPVSAYTIAGLVAGIDAGAVQHRLAGIVPERWAGGVLMGFGAAFFLRVIGIGVGALIGQAPVAVEELAVMIADVVIAPAWVIGGALLWRREPFGYVAGTGILFHGTILFVGLIAVMLLQPLMTAAPFVLVDVAVIVLMSLICIVPFALFVRGALVQGI